MKIKKLVQEEVRDLSSYEVKTILEQKPDETIVKLNLNESKTLALELKDVNDSERTLYFGVTLDW